MKEILLIFLLIIISIEDLKYYQVKDRYFLLLVILSFTYFNYITFILALCFCFILLFFYHYQMLGGADIKLYFISFMIVGPYGFIPLLLISNLLGLLCFTFKRRKMIPFIPCIAFSLIIVLIFNLKLMMI